MIRHLVLLVLFFGFCRGADPKPLLVVLERNPWLDVVGSDSPTFALYDDGALVYLREKPTADEPFRARGVIEAKAMASELLGLDPTKMESLYRLSAGTDGVITVIWTPSKKIKIYGNWRKSPIMSGDPDPRVKAIEEQEKEMWESLPPEIRTMLARIDQERSIEGRAWFPAKIEVMFWSYAHAPDASITWPKDWPSLTDKNTLSRNDTFSVFLPSDHWSELRSFLATRTQKGAVLIDGKKMAVAIRFPFPGEEGWMR